MLIVFQTPDNITAKNRLLRNGTQTKRVVLSLAWWNYNAVEINLEWQTQIQNKQLNQKLIEWWVTQEQVYIKYWRKLKWQPRMDNPETLATLGSQDIGRIQN